MKFAHQNFLIAAIHVLLKLLLYSTVEKLSPHTITMCLNFVIERLMLNTETLMSYVE